MLKCAPTRSFYKARGAYYKNTSFSGEGGMSGGPVFAQSSGNWYVCGVYVSGGGGVRAFDTAANNFINARLY
jgi:hypothetical protein